MEDFCHVIPLGVMPYARAFETQRAWHDSVLSWRDASHPHHSRIGVLLVVEHPPVITVSHRAGASAHILAPPELLAREGVEVCETDRGGDVTYHGPGQVVVYPILDLNKLGLGLHNYMRLLEQSVIDACAEWGLLAERDPTATGVWVRERRDDTGDDTGDVTGHVTGHDEPAKLAAFGVRVRRWVSMHGLALNASVDLSHFDLIVPCGLAGRRVTSLRRLLRARCPSDAIARAVVCGALIRLLSAQRAAQRAKPSNTPE